MSDTTSFHSAPSNKAGRSGPWFNSSPNTNSEPETLYKRYMIYDKCLVQSTWFIHMTGKIVELIEGKIRQNSRKTLYDEGARCFLHVFPSTNHLTRVVLQPLSLTIHWAHIFSSVAARPWVGPILHTNGKLTGTDKFSGLRGI